MNLLLVDDEEYVIESIRKNVDWEKSGITRVCTAFSMKQAQDAMDMIPVDVIISDIVMPNGSGFDFVEWVREKSYEVQVIFLTSYAEFDYARRAISLDSVDYLLKPIDFEKLEMALGRAVKKVEENRKYQDYQKASWHWKRNLPLLQKDYWTEVLRGNISVDMLQKEAEQRRLPYQESWKFLPISLIFYEGRYNQKIWDNKTLSFCVENVLSELLEKTEFQVETVVSMEESSFVVICGRKTLKCTPDEIKKHEIMERFVQWISEKVHMDVWCGVGSMESAEHIREAVSLIGKMRDNSLSVWNRVLYLSDFENPRITCHNPELGVWEALLEQEKKDELMESIGQYLEDISCREMVTREILLSFQMDVTQMVYSWLAKKEIKAHLLFLAEENEQYFQNSLRGVTGAKEYADHLLTKAIQYRKYVDKTTSVTEKICQYIDQHYKEEIRRDDLGELVYLNTDYMSRMFKKEVGVSISTYILQKRVEEAKKLLSQSNLPINTVSIYVGYSNFSYFTKMFKENTGYSPLEYRRKNQLGGTSKNDR